MSELPHDPLLERLRAADPAGARTRARGSGRERVVVALGRRRARRARRLGAAGAVTALAALLVLDLGPAGTSDSGILPRAVEAARLPAHSIVAIESELTFDRRAPAGGSVHSEQQLMTWLRTTRAGRLVRFRQLITAARGDTPAPAGSEETATTLHPGPWRTYDPRTRRSVTVHPRNTEVFPTTAFALRIRRLLAAAHPKLRLRHDAGFVALSWQDRVSPSETTLAEVRVDPETYAPIAHRFSTRFRDAKGGIHLTTVTERILSRRTLPDTPANRRLLMLRGPTR